MLNVDGLGLGLRVVAALLRLTAVRLLRRGRVVALLRLLAIALLGLTVALLGVSCRFDKVAVGTCRKWVVSIHERT